MTAAAALALACLLSAPAAAEPAKSAPVRVVPVLLVASDRYANDGAGWKRAESDFASAVRFAQAWYRINLGATFAVAKVETIASSKTSDEWIGLSCRSAGIGERRDADKKPCAEARYAPGAPVDRYGYFNAVVAEFVAKHPDADPSRPRRPDNPH